jgi:hypothetical protein
MIGYTTIPRRATNVDDVGTRPPYGWPPRKRQNNMKGKATPPMERNECMDN